MNRDLDRQLCERYPNLYRDRYASMRVTAMCWGFDCKDGWFTLIDQLSAQLEALILARPEEQRQDLRASQVKEKFGTLHFYMRTVTKEMAQLIEEAEQASATICETCGAAGVLRESNGWYFTACDEHSRGVPEATGDKRFIEYTVYLHRERKKEH